MEEKQIEIGGLKIIYKVFGKENQKSFLILHGWGSRSDRWKNIGEEISKKEYKVFIPDLPGFGKSDLPKTGWSGEDYFYFLEKFISDIGIEKFYLLGHSFGGGLAAFYAYRNPEKVEKLFLVDAACFRWQTFKKKFFQAISKIFRLFVFIPGRGLIKKFLYKIFGIKSDYISTSGTMRATYLKIIRGDLSGILTKIKVPTKIIFGEKDKITTLREARLIKQMILGSELLIIPKIGHNPHIEASRELLTAVEKFL